MCLSAASFDVVSNSIIIEIPNVSHPLPQELGVPMTILSRHATYKAPLQRGVYEMMAKGGNPIAARLLGEQKHSIGELWKR